MAPRRRRSGAARRYPWSGWSVDNPSNNYYYSFLRATMLLGLATHGENPQADGWLDAVPRRPRSAASSCRRSTRDLVGGGSREGTGYGVGDAQPVASSTTSGSASTGERIADLTPAHARVDAALRCTRPCRRSTASRRPATTSRDSTAALFDYHRD